PRRPSRRRRTTRTAPNTTAPATTHCLRSGPRTYALLEQRSDSSSTPCETSSHQLNRYTDSCSRFISVMSVATATEQRQYVAFASVMSRLYDMSHVDDR